MEIAAIKPPGPLPGWLAEAAETLIRTAERLIPGPSRGPGKKRWVTTALKKLAREHDIAAIPDWIETPAEDIIIDVVVELVFSTLPEVRHQRAAA